MPEPLETEIVTYLATHYNETDWGGANLPPILLPGGEDALGEPPTPYNRPHPKTSGQFRALCHSKLTNQPDMLFLPGHNSLPHKYSRAARGGI